MTISNPFGPSRCGPHTQIVDKVLDTAYLTVKEVRDALPELRELLAKLDNSVNLVASQVTGTLPLVGDSTVIPLPDGVDVSTILAFDLFVTTGDTPGRSYSYFGTSLTSAGLLVSLDQTAPAEKLGMDYRFVFFTEVTV